MKFLNLIKGFLNFYDFSPVITLSNQLNQIHQNFESVYITDSSFISLTSSTIGGSILISTIYSYVLIETTQFISCIANSMDSIAFSGGGIYFKSIEGSITLNKVCGYQCYGYSHGQLLYHYTKTTNKNQLFYLSINKCAPNYSNSRFSSFWLNNGIQKISNINSSFNEAYHHSSLSIRDQNSFDLKFSNFY